MQEAGYANGLKGLDFVVRDIASLQAVGGGHPGHAEGEPQHRVATCAWCRPRSGSRRRRPATSTSRSARSSPRSWTRPTTSRAWYGKDGPQNYSRLDQRAVPRPRQQDRARGGREQAQGHGPQGGGDSRERSAADPGGLRADLRRLVQPGARPEPVEVLRHLRRRALGPRSGWPSPRTLELVARAEVPAPAGAVRPGHPDRGLPDHLRGAAHPARRSAGGHPRRGRPRQDDAGGSRVDHEGPGAVRLAAGAVRPLAAGHRHRAARQVVLPRRHRRRPDPAPRAALAPRSRSWP